MTTKKQKVGQALLLLVWGPVIAILIGLGKVLADEEGRIPGWLGWLLGMAFRAVWASYDGFWKGTFGDGERTMEVDDGGEDYEREVGKERDLEMGKGRWGEKGEIFI